MLLTARKGIKISGILTHTHGLLMIPGAGNLPGKIYTYTRIICSPGMNNKHVHILHFTANYSRFKLNIQSTKC